LQLPAPLDAERSLQLCRLLHALAIEHMEHDEPRVRTLVAKAVGAYCRVSSSIAVSSSSDDIPAVATTLHHEIHRRIVDSIHEHLQKGRDDEKQLSRSSTGALDDTTGWRALETNWQCLAALVSAVNALYWVEFPVNDEATENEGGGVTQREMLEDCQYSAVTHVNRHVRAAAMAVLEQMVVAAAAATTSDDIRLLLTKKTSPLRETTVAVLRTGLADNWSQGSYIVSLVALQH